MAGVAPVIDKEARGVEGGIAEAHAEARDSTCLCSAKAFTRRVEGLKSSMDGYTDIWCHGFVHWPPPHILLRAWLLDNTLVKRRPTRLCARIRCQCACGRYC